MPVTVMNSFKPPTKKGRYAAGRSEGPAVTI